MLKELNIAATIQLKIAHVQGTYTREQAHTEAAKHEGWRLATLDEGKVVRGLRLVQDELDGNGSTTKFFWTSTPQGDNGSIASRAARLTGWPFFFLIYD
jgi:hypothetical protein